MRRIFSRLLIVGVVLAAGLIAAPSVAGAAPCGFYNHKAAGGVVSTWYHNCSPQGKRVKITYYGAYPPHVCVEGFRKRLLGYPTGSRPGAMKGTSVVGTCP